MIFREGHFEIGNWMQVLKWTSWDLLSSLVSRKINENNFNESNDYGAPFSEWQFKHGHCSNSNNMFNLTPPPRIASNQLDIYSVVVLQKS